jgi:hypothetical protein
LKAVTDGIGMRELALVGKKFPRPDKKAVEVRNWSRAEGLSHRAYVGSRLSSLRHFDQFTKPGFDILLKTFLNVFKSGATMTSGRCGKMVLEQNREERLGRLANAGDRTSTPPFSNRCARDCTAGERARYQRTNRLSPTLSRFAPSQR